MPAKQRGGSWKRAERFIAQAFGVVRTINNGKAQADVQIPGFSVESKKTKRLQALLINAMAQARRNTLPGRMPLLVIWKPQSAGSPTERLVVMDFADFVKLHGRAYGTTTATEGSRSTAKDIRQLPDAGNAGGAAADRTAKRARADAQPGRTHGDGDSRESPGDAQLGADHGRSSGTGATADAAERAEEAAIS